MNQILTGHFEADGGAHNLILGFVPNYLCLYNTGAVAGEVFKVEWWKEMGDADAIVHTVLADNGSTGNLSIDFDGSTGPVSSYNTNSVNTTNPVEVLGGEGVTIAATWMDDGDEIYYFAVCADREVDHGDIT